MIIRRHLDFNDTKFYDRVNMGNGLYNDTLVLIKNDSGFMVACVNKGWKLPIDYFLT